MTPQTKDKKCPECKGKIYLSTLKQYPHTWMCDNCRMAFEDKEVSK